MVCILNKFYNGLPHQRPNMMEQKMCFVMKQLFTYFDFLFSLEKQITADNTDIPANPGIQSRLKSLMKSSF